MTVHDDDLRALLEDAVSDVEPAPALGAVRRRTGRRTGRGWALPALGSGILVAAVLAAFLVIGQGPASAPQGQAAGPVASPSGESSDWSMTWPEDAGTQDSSTDESIVVASPADGATVTSPFTVGGTAISFEGTVTWELVPRPESRHVGTEKIRGFATAAECCTMSPYSFRVTAPPGDYTLVVSEEDASDGEGPPVSELRRRITVH